MQIRITTDRNVEGGNDLTRQVEAEVRDGLSRFSGRLTRVEVHLGDENAGKSGAADKRCVLEARPNGQPPVAVTNHASTIDVACRGAIEKLDRLLVKRFGRLGDRKAGASTRRPAPEG